MDQPAEVGGAFAAAHPDGLVERVEDQLGAHARRGPPTEDAPDDDAEMIDLKHWTHFPLM